jgi:tRNA/rRNA methyltransferase
MEYANIAVVLVEPKEGGNIGAVARAMSNMGLNRLVLVRPVDYSDSPAYRTALGGREILEQAVVASDLGRALENFHFVVGTTRREGDSRKERISPRVLAAEVARLSQSNETAILFGREDRGLTNGELKYCHRLVTIPSSSENRSLNLAQAVMVVAYELFLVGNEAVTAPLEEAVRKMAPRAHLEDLFTHMEEALRRIDYLHERSPERMMGVFRRVLARAALDEREVRALRGIFHQIEWYAGENVRPRGGKGKGELLTGKADE